MTDDDAELLAVLGEIQARGAIGRTDLRDAVAHADRFVAGIPATARYLADLGSGGGLPGLVIAVHCPQLTIVLVERRMTRADLLRRAIARLGLEATVRVHAADVQSLAATSPNSFDVVTARSFAAPPITARWGAALLRSGGLLLVSEPPTDSPGRWSADDLARNELDDQGRHQGIQHFLRR